MSDLTYLDTIGLKWEGVHPSAAQLRFWKHKPGIIDSQLVEEKYTYPFISPFGKMVTFNYYLNVKNSSSPVLYVEFSFPKFLTGTNFPSISYDKEEAFYRINKGFARDKNLPPIDVGSGLLSRLDVGCYFDVGNKLSNYLTALKQMDFPRRETMPYRYGGVGYKANKVYTKFYGKQQEMIKHKAKGARAAAGYLRQESTIRHPSTLMKPRYMGMEAPMLSDVTDEIAINILRKDREDLGIENTSIPDRFYAIDTLYEHTGSMSKSLRLFGMMEILSQTPPAEFRNKYNVNPSSFSRDKKTIEEAGLSLTILHEGGTLEPLEVAKFATKYH